MGKLLWSCLIVVTITASSVYLWSRYDGEKPSVGSSAGESAKNLFDFAKKQAEPVEWPAAEEQQTTPSLEEHLTPVPVAGDDADFYGEFELPPQVIAEVDADGNPPIEFPVVVPTPAKAVSVDDPQPGVEVEIPYPMGTAPRIMPFCEEESERQMPFAPEQQPKDDAITQDATPGAQGSEEAEEPYHHDYGCPSDYHRNYCPYTGRSYPSTYQEPKKETEPAGEEAPKGSSQSIYTQPTSWEDVKKRFEAIRALHKKMQLKQEQTPARQDIDTMECRPSDLKWRIFDPDL